MRRVSGVAVGLVLISAVMHATWNVLAKRSADPLAFLFAIGVAGVTLYTIPALIILRTDGLAAAGLPFLIASGILQFVYTLTLAAAYRNGALSLAYPVARGTGVLLVPLLAIPFLGEQPTTLAFTGIGTILAGLILINVLGARGRVATEIERGQRGVFFAFLTGLTITAYSLVDKAGVARVHPLLYVYGIVLIEVLILAPYILTRRREPLLAAWNADRRAVVVAGVLNVSTYLIVLAALRIGGSNVGYVVPLRETSIVVATLLGVFVLHERIGWVRLAGCGCIAVGVLAIALGG
jgi:drug/metabolite transporter (DMT)-like permease